MDITSSYGVRITGMNKIFYATNHIFQDAVCFVTDCVNDMWESVKPIKTANERQRFVETKIHSCRNHKADHPFDKRFPGMPSYMRRCVISTAVGNVASYRANHDNWIKAGKCGKPPKLGRCTRKAPVFYRGNMYKERVGKNEAQLKVYDGKNWVWITVKLRRQDVKYIEKHWSDAVQSAPRLEVRHGKARLIFAFTEKVALAESCDTAVGCDLGINTDATLCAMRSDGTVFARKFINFADEKARLFHLMGIASKLQRKSGFKASKHIWEYITLLSKLLADHIAREITEFARSVNADVIVFEHLDMKGKRTKRQKLAMWRKNDIQKRVMHKAHRAGIRVSRVCAWNTSKLAFDGSGTVVRDKDNHSLCTFKSGKRYNCDLSASYNIAARYFLRELSKPLPETARSYIKAKVPGCMARTAGTLSVLRNFCAALEEFALPEAELKPEGHDIEVPGA